MIISAKGNNICNTLAEARRVANLPLEGNREVIRSGGEDGLHRVHLESGVVVECTIIQRSRCEAYIAEQ